jgi:hypothetical protein
LHLVGDCERDLGPAIIGPLVGAVTYDPIPRGGDETVTVPVIDLDDPRRRSLDVGCAREEPEPERLG